MGLTGKLTAATEFKAGGDVFHELFSKKPHHFSIMSPDKIQCCDLHEGEYGKVGSIIHWRYIRDGKEKFLKEIIKEVDEEKKIVKLEVIDGELVEQNKSFIITCHVETKGDIDLVVWTCEYEMLNEDVQHPFSFLSYLVDLTKDIEAHQVGKT